MLNKCSLPTIATISVVLMAIGVLRLVHHQLYGGVLFYASFIILITTIIGWLVAARKKQSAPLSVGLKLALFASLMFAFSYVMVPLYHVLCHVLGLNSEISQTHQTAPQVSTHHRSIPSTSLVTHYRGMNWDVHIAPNHLTLIDNALLTQTITLYNPDDTVVNARLKVGFSPGHLSNFLHPVTPLQNKVIHVPPHTHKHITVQWLMTSDVPPYKDVTLHYAFFPIQQTHPQTTRRSFLSGE